MAHQPWHQPQWGLGGRPNRSTFGGLLTTPMQLPAAVESLSDETEEERKAKKDKLWDNWGETATDVGQQIYKNAGGTVGLETGPREWQPMMNLGMGRQQYGGRSPRRRYA